MTTPDTTATVPDEAVRADGGHVLRVTADMDTVTIGVVCLEPVGATCRRWCAKPGCDREEAIPHYDHDHDGLSPEEREHPTGDVGYCLVAEWINESGPAGECHDPTAGPEPIADGLPVTTEWDGDGYIWRVAEIGWVLVPGPVETEWATRRFPSDGPTVWADEQTARRIAAGIRVQSAYADHRECLYRKVTAWRPAPRSTPDGAT